MTPSQLRTVALTVKSRVAAMFAATDPMYNEVMTWALDGTDAALPTIAHVKAALLAYDAFEKPALHLYNEVREIKMSPDEAATLPDTLAVDWEEVTNKPDFALSNHTHPEYAVGTAHQHTRKRFALPVVFPGTLTAGMSHVVLLPIDIVSAQMQSLCFALGSTGSADFTTFGLDAFVDVPEQGEQWVSCLTNPAFSAMGISSGGYPKGSASISQEIDMGRVVLPKTEWTGFDLLKITIVQAAPGAADAVVVLNFDAVIEAFEEESGA